MFRCANSVNRLEALREKAIADAALANSNPATQAGTDAPKQSKGGAEFARKQELAPS